MSDKPDEKPDDKPGQPKGHGYTPGDYRDKLGPIPEEHFDNDPRRMSEEEMARRSGGTLDDLDRELFGEKPPKTD